MSGDIFFGFDKLMPLGSQGNDGYVDSPTFDAFGDLLNAALAHTYPAQLAEITEGQYQMLYSFCRLSARDYNAVIRVIRTYRLHAWSVLKSNFAQG